MIQFLADNIDQLDLALDQLALTDRNYDRFALMLIDNVVELTLHKFARDKASENELWVRLNKPKYDPKLIKKALDQHFENKIRAASALGLIDITLCDSILYLHSYRNTAYHKGLRHESILHSLAVFYFRSACTLLKAYSPRYWSWGGSDKVPHRAMKYIGTPRFGDSKELFQAAFARLDNVAGALKENLIGDLSADMGNTIKMIDFSIDFLATNSPTRQSRDEVIISSQAWSFAITEEGKTFVSENGCQEKFIEPVVNWIAANYKWKINKDPIPSWNSRLKSLASGKDPHRAVKRYCDFMQQTEQIRSIITNAANQLAEYIQNEIDIARGK
jgi:hypothetical protein